MTLDEFELVHAPRAPEQLAAFERSIGSALPDGFRRFLARCDGGRPGPNRLDNDAGTAVGLGVTQFLGIGDGDNSIRTRLDEYAGRTGAGLLPIADAEGGNLVLLSIAGPDVGSVWFWDHEMEADEGEPPRPEALTRVAGDFEELLADLVRSDGQAPTEASDATSAWIDPQFLAQLRQQDGQD
jgi:hypothetical protein